MLAALQNLLSLATSWKAYIIVSGLVIAAIGGFYGYAHHQGVLSCEAAQKQAASNITKKEEVIDAKIDKAVPATRAGRVKWMLALSASSNK